MNQRIGYDSGVFTSDLRLGLRLDALLLSGCELIYEEAASNSAFRPQLTQCLKMLRPGDTLVVWRLGRLGSNLQKLVKIVDGLECQNIQFGSLGEEIETGTLQHHVFVTLAEFERDLIRERTCAGFALALARGRRGGRPPKFNDKQVHTIKSLLRDPASCVAGVARDYEVSRTTIYKHCGVVPPRLE